jgi:hypothetical protein
MLIKQPTLAEQAAGMREAAQASRAPRWLPDALHAMLMALLARLFTRLEDMIQLWQSGLLLPPSARIAAVPATTQAPGMPTALTRRKSVRRRARAASRLGQFPHAGSRATATPRATPSAQQFLGGTNLRPIDLPPLRPRLQHGPPPYDEPCRFREAFHAREICGQLITITQHTTRAPWRPFLRYLGVFALNPS